ncbi:MAG: hypothetical protein AB1439_09650 [candidate division FCPU426 bacterium]
MSKTKAVHLQNFRKLVMQQAGEQGLTAIANRLNLQDQALLNQSLLSSQWIDYGFWWRLLVAADQVLGQGDYQWIRTMGGFDAQENLQGIYRSFLKMMSIKAVIRSSDLIWRRYYDTGEMRVMRLDSDEAELHLHNFPELPLHHEAEVVGWMEGAMRLGKATLVEVKHDLCLAKGDPYCRFIIHWQE